MASEAEAIAARLLGREVRVGGVSFSWFYPTLQISEVLIAGPTAESLAVGSAREISIDISLKALLHRSVVFDRIEVIEPHVFIEIAESGQDNLPRLNRSKGSSWLSEGSWSIEVGAVNVDRGTAIIGQRQIPIDLKARNLRARFESDSLGALDVGIDVSDLEIILPNASPYVGAVGVRGRLTGSNFELLGARVSGPFLKSAMSGQASWSDQLKVQVASLTEIDAELLQRLSLANTQVGGSFRLNGDFRLEDDQWSYVGDLSSRATTLVGRRFRDLSGRLEVDAKRIRLGIQKALYGSGSVSGEILLNRQTQPFQVALDFDLKDVELDRVMVDQGVVLTGVFGEVSGPVNYGFAWPDFRQGSGRADLQIISETTEINDAPDGIFLNGSAPFVIEQGVLQANSVNLNAVSQNLMADGFYDLTSQTGSFDYLVESKDLAQLLSVLPSTLETEEPTAWMPDGGQGVIEGTFELAESGAETRVEMSLPDFRAPGVNADLLKGRFTVTDEGLQDIYLDLGREDGRLIVSGNLPLERPGEDQPELPLSLAVDALNWPLSDAQAWLPFKLPLDGRVSGLLQIGGSLEQMEGTLKAEIHPVTASTVDFGTLRLDVDFDPQHALIREALLESEAGELHSQGELNLVTGELGFSLEGSGLDLEKSPFPELLPGEIDGELRVTAQIGGNVERLVVDAEVGWLADSTSGTDVSKVEESVISLRVQDGSIAIDGDLFNILSVSGTGTYQGAAVDLVVEFQGEDLPALADALTGVPMAGLEGLVEGELRVSGQVSGEDALRINLVVPLLDTTYKGRRLRNVEPIEIGFEADRVEIRSIYLEEDGGGSEFILVGHIGLDSEEELDLNVEGSITAGWMGLLFPEYEFDKGSFELLAHLSGTVQQPRFNGQGKLNEVRWIVPQLSQSVDRATGTVLFYPDEIVVENVAGEFAGGRIRASGSIQPLSGFGDVSYNLRILGEDLSLRYPEGWLAQGDAEFLFNSVEGGRQVRGSITLDRALYLNDVKVGLTQLFKGVLGRQRLEAAEMDEILASTHLNLAVIGKDALRIRNNIADLRGGIDLSIRGSLARPVIFGTVEVDRGGVLVYGDNEYTLERGVLAFANPHRIEPVLDLVATADVREYDVTLNLSGPLDQLNAEFAAEPPLADLEVLSLLTTGEYFSSARGSKKIGAEEFLYGQAASLVAQRANRLFGLDQFRIVPLSGTSGDLSSARVTVGDRIASNLYATFSYDPSQTAQQILQVEWTLDPGLVLVMTQNGDDTYAVDLRWEKSF